MISSSEVLRRLAGATNVARMRQVRREISREVGGEARAPILKLAVALIESGLAARFVAYELIEHHPSARDGLTAAEVERLAAGMADWASVDCFGCCISGPAWREGRISDRVIERWAASQDRWRRRAALVSTVPLNLRARGGKGDAVRTLAMCELLLDDRDDMVVKALSWALRSLAVRDAKAVRVFLAKHEGRLAARVLREVRNKLSTGLKNPKGALREEPAAEEL